MTNVEAPGTWLSRTDPPFFVSYTTVIIAYLGAGIQTVYAPQQYLVPGYKYLNDWARPEVWGWLAIAAGVFMLLGLWGKQVWVMRVGLVCGLLLTVAFTVGIGLAWTDGETVGVGFWIWMAITGSNVARLMQPVRRA